MLGDEPVEGFLPEHESDLELIAEVPGRVPMLHAYNNPLFFPLRIVNTGPQTQGCNLRGPK